jgi:hypothetical protein
VNVFEKTKYGAGVVSRSSLALSGNKLTNTPILKMTRKDILDNEPIFSDILNILRRHGIRSRMLLQIVKWSLAFSLALLPATAKSSEYSGWKEQKFSLFSSNDFVAASDGLDIISEGTVSLLWSAVPEDKRSSVEAVWSWEVSTSVPPTDLTVKGGDDRNIAVYFVFAPEDQVEELATGSISMMLSNPTMKVLMYVHGGEHDRGAFLETPYLGEHGKTIILRSSGLGRFEERVNLALDFKKAFDLQAFRLMGLAISADSDDTKSKIVAKISPIELR